MKPTLEPFPHVVADDWWSRDWLEAVRREFPDPDEPGWKVYGGDHERKLEGPPVLWGSATQDLFFALGREEFCAELAETFGLPPLTMDPIGGGYHLIPPGGYLGVHTDFNRGPSGTYRRLNLMVYLNHDWNDPGGLLQLCYEDDQTPKYVRPEFGRTVVFETSDHSWHGHPQPASRWRRSVAAYFFSQEQPPGYERDHSTVWAQ